MCKEVFGSNYPCGPCNHSECVCSCGWEYNEDEVNTEPCDEDDEYGCEICQYCSTEKCPICGNHVCCGGCV